MPEVPERSRVSYFDEKFKKTLREHYVYGYKTSEELQKSWVNEKKEQISEATISNDKTRLKYILKDCCQWKKNEGKIEYVTIDSQSMKENPFHQIYHFCLSNKNNIFYFFNVMLALKPEVKLTDLEVLVEYQKYYERKIEKNKNTKNSYSKEKFEEKIDSSSKGDCMESSELACIYSHRKEEKPFSGDKSANNTINKHLKNFEQFGFIKSVSNTEELNSGDTNQWILEDLTIDKILNELSDTAGGKKTIEQFIAALNFFSRYERFGEIGTFLLDRIDSSEKYVRKDSLFRVKHDYFMEALNDFDLIDLLYAIEEEKFCVIYYKHATENKITKTLCLPLEIRVSVVNGREFLIYYKPGTREYSSFRLEFIDKIEIVSDAVKEAFLKNDIKEADIRKDLEDIKAAYQQTWGVSVQPKQGAIDATEAIPVHDVSLGIKYHGEYYIEDRMKREKRFGEIAVSKEEEKIRFNAKVTDPVELRPWIRSFYGRLLELEIEAPENLKFDVQEDLSKISELYKTSLPGTKKEDNPFKVNTNAEEDYKENDRLLKKYLKMPNNKKTKDEMPHRWLFNEYLSTYFFVIAEFLMNIYSSAKDELTTTELEKYQNEALNKYERICGSKTENRVFNTQESDKKAFLIENSDDKDHITYKKKFKTDLKSFYASILPLSILERRWLLTILNEPEMKGFLEEKAIEKVKNMINPDYKNMNGNSDHPSSIQWVRTDENGEMLLKKMVNGNSKNYKKTVYFKTNQIKPLPLDKIVYYDRFGGTENISKIEIENLKVILEAIQDKKEVKMAYWNSMDKVYIDCRYWPICFEYSKRDHKLRGYFYCLEKEKDKNNEKIFEMNLNKMEKMELKEVEVSDGKRKRDRINEIQAEAEAAFKTFKDEQTVTLIFKNERNMLDRILYEFAPWRKECNFQKEGEYYKLKLYYKRRDMLELVIRFLGYGKDLKLIDETLVKVSENDPKPKSLIEEYEKRINDQLEIENSR